MTTKRSIFSKRHYEALAVSLAEISPLVKTSPSEASEIAATVYDLGVQSAIAHLARMLAEDSERFDSGRFFRRIAGATQAKGSLCR